MLTVSPMSALARVKLGNLQPGHWKWLCETGQRCRTGSKESSDSLVLAASACFRSSPAEPLGLAGAAEVLNAIST